MYRMKRQGRVLMCFVVLGAVVATGCNASSGAVGAPTGATNGPEATDEPVVLRMANTYGDLGQLPAVAYFVDRVEELSGGDLQVTVADAYGEFSADVEQRVVDHVAAAKMDVAWVGTRVIDTMGVRSFQALTAPRLVDSYALQNAVIESGITEKMLPALDDVGVVGLAVLAGGLRKPIGVKEPLVGPADWEGIGFGTYKSDGQEEAIRALGATPAAVFGPNREAAIADDAIQGFEMGLSIYQDPKWIDLAPYVTANVNLWPQMDVLIASPARLEALTSEQRGWLHDAADEAASRSASLADTEAEVIKAACDTGARFAEATDADLAALDDIFAPVYPSLEQDAETKSFIEQIRALKGSIPAESDPVIPAGCSGTADEGGTEGTHPPVADDLVGEWHQEFTCDDSRDAVERAVKPEVVETWQWGCELTGPQLRIALFRDGRLFLKDPPEHEVGLTADYELVDDRTFTLSDGGRNIPDTYRFEYRIDGDRLIVDVLEEDPFFVGAWEAAPFVRVE